MNSSRRLLNTLRQFGLDPLITIKAFRNLSRFILDYLRFRKLGPNQRIFLSPALNDFDENSGSARGHYFWQDLICAKWIFHEHPMVHLDLGSRIDGFICHLLTFTHVETLDIRPLNVEVPGLTSRIVDAQTGLSEFIGQYISVSSLHSLEHFGLGRYNDPLDLDGHLKGIQHLSETVQLGGILYVSFPIGRPQIEFNSQRIVDPLWAVETLTNFSLEEFVLIPWVDPPKFGLEPSQVDPAVEGQCGLYKMRRIR